MLAVSWLLGLYCMLRWLEGILGLVYGMAEGVICFLSHSCPSGMTLYVATHLPQLLFRFATVTVDYHLNLPHQQQIIVGLGQPAISL